MNIFYTLYLIFSFSSNSLTSFLLKYSSKVFSSYNISSYVNYFRISFSFFYLGNTLSDWVFFVLISGYCTTGIVLAEDYERSENYWSGFSAGNWGFCRLAALLYKANSNYKY